MLCKTVIASHKTQGSISENKSFLYGLSSGTSVTATA